MGAAVNTFPHPCFGASFAGNWTYRKELGWQYIDTIRLSNLFLLSPVPESIVRKKLTSDIVSR